MKDPNLNRLLSHGIILLGCILFGVSCICFGTEPLHPLSLLAGAVPFAGLAFSFFAVRCPYCGHTPVSYTHLTLPTTERV